MIRNLPANGQTALGTQAAQAAVDAKRLTMDQAVSLEEIAKKLPKAATKAEVEAYLDTAVASLALASPELAAEFPRIFREAVAHAAQAFAEIARSPVDSLRAAMGALPSRSTVPRTLLAADFLRANYDLDGLQQLAQRLDARKSVSLVNKNAGALDLAGHFVRRLLDSELLDAIAAMPPGARPAPKSFPIGDARLCAELASAQALGKSALVDFVRDHIDADELPFLHLRIGNHPEDAVGARGLVDSAAQLAGLDALVTAIASELAISEDFDSLAPQRIESSTRFNSASEGRVEFDSLASQPIESSTRFNSSAKAPISPGPSARVDSLRRELEIADQSSVARTVSVVAFVRANYDLAGLKELAAGIGADGINVSNKNVAALNLGSFVVRRCRESEFLDVLAKTPPAAPKPIALPTPSPLPPFDVSDAQSSKKTLYPWLMGHNKEALRDLAAAIGMDPDNLPEDQSESARELFLFSERRLLHPALVALASGESPTPALLAARKQLRAELASAQDTMSLYKFLDTHFEGEELSFLELPLGLPGTGTIMRRAQALAESGQTNPTLAEAMAREMGISEH